MKKLLTKGLTVLALASVVTAAAWAYFTDSETNTGNSFALGTVDIVLDGDTMEGSAYFSVDNMAPGDSVDGCVVVRNEGNLDALFRGYLTNLTDPDGLKDVLNVKMVLNPTTECAEYTPRFDPVSDYTIYDNTLAGIVGAGTSDAMDNIPQAFHSDDQVFHPGENAVYYVTVTLPFSAGNTYQGTSFAADLVFEATQFKNQDPANVMW